MTGIVQDLRYAFRALARTPGFTAVALAILTLSIGASTAIFTVVDVVVLRALPFYDSQQLVAVGELNIKDPSFDPRNRVAPQNFLDWRARQDVFTGLAATWDTSITLRREGHGEPEVLRALWTTADLFPVLRVNPLIGHPFTSENEVSGRARVAVISYGLWQRRFGGTPDVVGRHLPGILGDIEILGVMPPDFQYPVGAREPTELWIPFVVPDDERVRGNRYGYNLQVIGRLRDGTSIEQAQARMDLITAELAAETPRWFTDRVAKVELLHEYLTRSVRTWMLLLLSAVACVLLIACVNLANLMLVRATTRTRELGVRSALGASRWDLCRMLLAESLILSAGGAVCGLLVANLGVDLLRATMPGDVPRVSNVSVDLRVLVASALMAVVMGLLFGLTPLLHFWRERASQTLYRGERGATAGAAAQGLRSILVVAEVALATVLLIGAALFLGSFARVTSIDLGIDHRDLLMVRVRPFVGPAQASTGMPITSLETARAQHPEMLERVLERVRAIPGVQVASLATGGLPLRGDLITVDFGIPGRELPRNNDIDFNEITPEYFETLKVPLLRGRLVTENDRQESQPVVVLKEAAARRYFGVNDAIGKVVRLRGERTVIGVVGNIRHDGPEGRLRTQAFVPFAQSRPIGATLVLRTTVDPQAVLPAVKAAIWSEFPDVPISDVHAVEALFGSLVAQRQFNMILIGMFGLLGLAIASIGVYGVMAYAVAQRTNEFGIRIALGALPSAITHSVLARALTYIGIGVVIGLSGATALAGFVRSFLFEVQVHDPVVYASAVTVLTITGMFAALVPARRAARVDPLVALRYE